MQNALLIVCIASALVGCSRQSPSSPPSGTGLIAGFESKFDRLFLSHEPLRYQDNSALLSSIQKTALNPKELELVRAKFKEFLSAKPKPRPYAPDSMPTGVASETAFLRLQALRILAEIGTKDDETFIRGLDHRADEHPLFDGECQKAVKKLEAR